MSGERIPEHIGAFRKAQASDLEQDLFKHKKRLGDAQRSHAENKPTGLAKTNAYKQQDRKLSGAPHRFEAHRSPSRMTSRIFPMYFARLRLAPALKLVSACGAPCEGARCGGR
jgi:hypothetical protein